MATERELLIKIIESYEKSGPNGAAEEINKIKEAADGLNKDMSDLGGSSDQTSSRMRGMAAAAAKALNGLGMAAQGGANAVRGIVTAAGGMVAMFAGAGMVAWVSILSQVAAAAGKIWSAFSNAASARKDVDALSDSMLELRDASAQALSLDAQLADLAKMREAYRSVAEQADAMAAASAKVQSAQLAADLSGIELERQRALASAASPQQKEEINLQYDRERIRAQNQFEARAAAAAIEDIDRKAQQIQREKQLAEKQAKAATEGASSSIYDLNQTEAVIRAAGYAAPLDLSEEEATQQTTTLRNEISMLQKELGRFHGNGSGLVAPGLGVGYATRPLSDASRAAGEAKLEELSNVLYALESYKHKLDEVTSADADAIKTRDETDATIAKLNSQLALLAEEKTAALYKRDEKAKLGQQGANELVARDAENVRAAEKERLKTELQLLQVQQDQTRNLEDQLRLLAAAAALKSQLADSDDERAVIASQTATQRRQLVADAVTLEASSLAAQAAEEAATARASAPGDLAGATSGVGRRQAAAAAARHRYAGVQESEAKRAAALMEQLKSGTETNFSELLAAMQSLVSGVLPAQQARIKQIENQIKALR